MKIRTIIRAIKVIAICIAFLPIELLEIIVYRLPLCIYALTYYSKNKELPDIFKKELKMITKRSVCINMIMFASEDLSVEDIENLYSNEI